MSIDGMWKLIKHKLRHEIITNFLCVWMTYSDIMVKKIGYPIKKVV